VTAAVTATLPPARHPVEAEQQVTPLELFFDLVFVFAITQVTALMAHDPSWLGLLRGIAVLAALWFAWAAYSWLTNFLPADEGAIRLVMFMAMAAMLVVALAVPEAFGDEAMVFAVAYFVVRTTHIVLYGLATNDVDVRGAVLRLAPTVFLACGLLVVAALADDTLRGVLWGVALAVDYSGPYVIGVRGWKVHPGHFAERYGLIVIIALGESIVAVGVGAEGLPLDAGVIAAAVLGIVVAASLWWAYFDVVAPVAERRLRGARGHAANRLARDSYSYLHLPMVAGIVLVALGGKKTLEHVDEPLEAVSATALCGGAALYLAAHVAFRARNVGSVNRQRIVAAFACLALIPLATTVDSLAALAAIATVLATLISFEALYFREARARVRETR
jgi:low temperature requirement protein LtrA